MLVKMLSACSVCMDLCLDEWWWNWMSTQKPHGTRGINKGGLWYYHSVKWTQVTQVSTTDSGYEWRLTTTTFLMKPHSTTITFMYLSVNALTNHVNIQVTVCYKNIKKTNEQELDKYQMKNCEYCINRSRRNCSSLYQCFINLD